MKKYGKRMQFDPMTGELIDPEAKFDPMTGKPLYSNNGKQGKTGKKIAIIGGVTAVAAIGLTVFGAVKSGIFFSDSTKVLMATANTVRDMEYFSDIVKSAEILSSGKYTTTIHAGLEDTEAEAQILRGKAKVQIAAQVEFPDSDQVSALAELNEREARLEVPVLSDKMFAYNYREEKGGYLADEGVLENVDEVLQLAGQALGEEKDVQKMWKELVSSLSEEWKEVEVVRRNPEEYEVDGKFRKCKGYTVSLTEENMEDLLSVTEDIVTDYSADYDLILMDIEMAFLNGMKAAEKIRELDKDVIIIFITNMPQYAIQGYKVNALDYMLKPISYFSFSESMGRALHRVNVQEKEFITIALKGGKKKLDITQICYVEVQDHLLLYHTTEGSFATKGTIRDAESQLDAKSFFRCNRCYLVNLEYVDNYMGSDVSVNGDTIQVSRSRRKPFLDALNEYLNEVGK